MKPNSRRPRKYGGSRHRVIVSFAVSRDNSSTFPESFIQRRKGNNRVSRTPFAFWHLTFHRRGQSWQWEADRPLIMNATCFLARDVPPPRAILRYWKQTANASGSYHSIWQSGRLFRRKLKLKEIGTTSKQFVRFAPNVVFSTNSASVVP